MSRLPLSLSFTALSITALWGCQCEETLDDVPGTLSGVACNDVGGQPLPSTVVTFDGPTQKTAATNAVGFYKSPVLPPGEYTVSVDISGRNRTIGTATVESRFETPVVDTACTDPPDEPEQGCVSGDICNRHVGSLVAGGRVIVKVGTFQEETTTDDAGHFRLCGAPEGEGTVTISGSGFQRTFVIDIDNDVEFNIDLDDNCDAQTTSTGCVIASICDPALGADSDLVAAAVTVVAVGAGAGEVTNEITDTEGFFEVCGLVPGEYEVRIQEGATDHTEIVEIVAGETSQLLGPEACENRVEVGRIEGQVCDEDVGGVFSGTVELHQGSATGPLVGGAVLTDANGTFRFENLVPGDYFVAFPQDPALSPIGPITVTAFQTTPLEARNCPLPDDVCEEFIHEPETTSDGRVFFIVDKSGSMQAVAQGFDNNGINKWDALKRAVQAVTTTFAGSDGIDYALVAYPDPARSDCGASCVDACAAGTQQVAMGGDATQVNASLSGINPFGGTPTASTLAATRATIESLSAIERPLAVVLATDGAPNCATTDGLGVDQEALRVNCGVRFGAGSVCTSNVGNCVASGASCSGDGDCGGGDTCNQQSDASCSPFNCLDLTAIDRVRDIEALGVDVHVIGIRGANEASAAFTNTLDAMAVAGGAALPAGSPTRFHDATNIQALEDALAAVTRRIVACSITTPFNVQSGAVSVKVGDNPILRNESRTNGWDATGPNSIQLFGTACDRATTSGSNITVGRCAPGG